ncbi:YxlC family protein [Bacillus benzoevorans]|uniref:YxlC family protein n=1 Tax=Bacillus benzoevorans TaxID=1456 RepID=A0A7X0LY18_9BACI|nr:YxlC family protein [Bacillus benzoevorans]MBB6446999.1 hypothetical protein [Bacillus benzoevorans]
MTNHKDAKDKLLSRLQIDWKQLDQLGSQPAPGKASIKEQLAMAKAEKRKAFYKELSLFITFALLILTVLITIVFKAPQIFIWTQVLSLVAAPIIFLVLNKRRAKEADFYER